MPAAYRSRHGDNRTTNQQREGDHVTDKSRPLDGRAVIQVEMPRSAATQQRRPEIRHHSADDDVIRRPVGLRVVIGRQPEVEMPFSVVLL